MIESTNDKLILETIAKMAERHDKDRDDILVELRKVTSLQEIFLYRLSVLEKDMDPVKKTVDKVVGGFDMAKLIWPILAAALAHASGSILHILQHIGYI